MGSKALYKYVSKASAYKSLLPLLLLSILELRLPSFMMRNPQAIRLLVSAARRGNPDQIRTLRKGIHISAYDKNQEELAQPVVLPDDAIHSNSDKYWGPHPRTGVFGPLDRAEVSGNRHLSSLNHDSGSVLDRKSWFRGVEDVSKDAYT